MSPRDIVTTRIKVPRDVWSEVRKGAVLEDRTVAHYAGELLEKAIEESGDENEES